MKLSQRYTTCASFPILPVLQYTIAAFTILVLSTSNPHKFLTIPTIPLKNNIHKCHIATTLLKIP